MPPNQALHLTGAAILVSRDIKLLQRPRQLSLVVGPNDMKKLITLFILAFLLSGCVGVVALYPESTTYREPFAPDTSFTDSAGKLRSTKTSTQEAFLREWGEPSHREVGAENESWTYYRGKEWCGVVLGLVIPIPLILPVCSAEDRIVFQGGAATSITVLHPNDAGIMCGLFVNGLHGGPDLCSK